MDQLEKMPQLQSIDVQGFEKFADLVRITVVKLQAEQRNGKQGEGILHSLLVKKLAEDQVEKYVRWIQEQTRERSVQSLKEWLKEEVLIRVEAMEMTHGLVVDGSAGGGQSTHKNQTRHKGSRNFHIGPDVSAQAKGPAGWQNHSSRKPPCACCNSPYHGV